MANTNMTFQLAQRFGIKDLVNQPQTLGGTNFIAIADDNSGAFLPPVLERKQSPMDILKL